MGLAAGAKLGPYEVLSRLGAGGMGEVYRARDTKLNREVALKVLPDVLARDPQRMGRFEREAQLLASLNHPHIATLHGLEETGATRALVMELVEGPTLAERLQAGPVPFDEALPLAKQIAEALEYAHERGIVHRDLKPANVKLTPEGAVKVLDFGLAKALGPEEAVQDISKSPTLSVAATQAGVILGTAAYMAPEQARGKAVDRRADIWAFGVVLYEMLSRQRLFDGETVSDTLASVLKSEPDWAALPAETPPRLRELVRRCLTKDPKQRLRDIGEARIAIEQALSGADFAAAQSLGPVAETPPLRRVLLWALAGLLAGATLAWILKPAPKAPPVVRIAQPLGSEAIASSPVWRFQNLVAISPDGTRTVLATADGLLLRSFDSLEAALVPETQGATDPTFSPDGRWIAFEMGGELKKVPVGGGAPTTICPLAVRTTGLSWAPDGSFLIGGYLAGILRVGPEGGPPTVLVRPASGGIIYVQPRALPGGKTFLFVRGGVGGGGREVEEVVMQTMGKDDGTVVVSGVRGGAYLSGGRLIYLRDAGLFAAAFDPKTRKIESEPVTLAQNTRALTGRSISHFAVSDTGTLVYVETPLGGSRSRLVDVDRSGKVTALPTEVRSGYSDPRVSPDGRQVAVHVTSEEDDVWVANPERGTISRLSFDPGEDETPAWSPDGRWVAWAATRAGVVRGIYRRAADGSGGEELLWKTDLHTHLRDWLADGKTMVIESQDPATGSDIWRLELGDKVTATPFLRTPYNERGSRVSPDGGWIAYSSDESGREEVYVQSFPGPGAKLQVSVGGGMQPVWSRDGRSLFFRGNGSVQEVSFHPGPRPAVGEPQPLFADSFEAPQGLSHTGYDSRPGGGLLMIQSAEPQSGANAAQSQMVFVFNLFKN